MKQHIHEGLNGVLPDYLWNALSKELQLLNIYGAGVVKCNYNLIQHLNMLVDFEEHDI